ncbi:neopullulanase SusA [Thalassotalea insulae]|uniref:Neopullulanase SusA n=1 Tax=Thalassotalea insulae TaxID=2056778 RepID=A0ABQ6GSZ3_9GAMM|nr:glycoside hydrolase family 13 protein [Thalassotalea insulae]GLX79068.1 neopullulanase SusA [Thalassotalea insulae]
MKISKTLFSLFTAASLTCSAISQAQQYQIQHLEPLSWWTKMASNKLQLMVHGNNIAQLTPKFTTPAIKVVGVHPGDSANYLFIDLELATSLTPGSYTLDFYHKKDKVLSTQYRFNARNTHSAADQSFSPKDVIYLITPDRFANGDPSNDNQPTLSEGLNRSAKGGRHGGDIQGMINHLDYIAAMGFTQIWPNPMVENNQPNHSYHGYSATDFYQIDARFGTNELYQQLSEKAQQKGLGLIKDVVLNHIGSQHWWMQDLPMKDWLNFQAQSFTGTHHKRESLHDPYATEYDKTQFSDGWFVPSMPDLNQRNPFVSTYLIQNTLWWIEYANLTGLRVDTFSYSDRKFLTRWTQAISREYPNINIVGEEWTTNPAIVSYWQRGKINQDGYQTDLPSLMDFPLQQALVNALTKAESWNTGLNQLYQSLANDFLYPDPGNLVTFTDNHDMSRIFTQLNQDVARYKMAMSILLTTRGIPQVFYGTEIAMANPGTDDHGIIRSDFPGGWSTDISNAFNETNLSTQQTEVLNFTKTLLNWRKSATAIHQGKLVHYAPNNGLYVYGRLLPLSISGNNVMVIVNKNQKQITLNPNDYPAITGQSTKATNIITEHDYALTKEISVQGHSVMILELKR